MDNKDKIKLYNQFNRIHNKFTIIKRKLAGDSNNSYLTPAEMQVLCLIAINPEFTVTDIALQLYITKSAASQLVKKLCSKGMLQKFRSESNERIVILITTDNGKIVIENFFNNESHAFGEMVKDLTSMSTQELDVITVFFDKLEKMFDKKIQ
ncbi:UNVERIFIED_CONTAM: MarR family transcriptional regulator [Acetivibrio alkalicellulosi]